MRMRHRMRFEKLEENKIRITLSQEDLVKKDIDFHSFMSNSLESQDLFFDMLEEAEKEIGFVTKDYLIRIEALALAGGDFVLTVTRTLPEKAKNSLRKKVHIRRKRASTDESQVVYSFANFDDFCSFITFFKDHYGKASNLAQKVLLYEYHNTYYLVLSEINLSFPDVKRLFSCIPEFAVFVSHSKVFTAKLAESGTLVLKHNAIQHGMKYFV